MKILVIEDNPKHLNDARMYSETLVDCQVDFATNLIEAKNLLMSNIYDGVISDVFFPTRPGDSADSFDNAVELSSKLVEMNIHHVFNTDSNHHGRKLRDFCWKTPRAVHNENDYHCLTTGMLIESYPEEMDEKKDKKQWQAAFRYILVVLEMLKLPDKGDQVRCPGGFPYGDYGELTQRFEECTDPFVLSIIAKYHT